MAKKKLSISQLKKVSEKAVDAMEGKTDLQKNRKIEKQKRKDNVEYRTVRINKDLHHKLKMEAVKNQMKITDYLEMVLEKNLK